MLEIAQRSVLKLLSRADSMLLRWLSETTILQLVTKL